MPSVPSELDVSVLVQDISESMFAKANESLIVGIDLETTGLDWLSDEIASVQVAVPGGSVEIVRFEDPRDLPRRIVSLLESSVVLKVFHHAMFDLRFIRVAWDVQADRVACTKVAAKIADPRADVGHHLVDLVEHYLGLSLNKDEQVSDWRSKRLSTSQIEYAANDVRHLPSLLYALLRDLRNSGLERLALKCFRHLPTRVELEVLRLGDVFTY
jgi:ribonuclease D